MTTFESFLDRIKEAGIQITNEDALAQKARSVADWPSAVAKAVLTGRNEGIRFERATPGEPTNDRLATILGGYSFTPIEVRVIIDNTLLADRRA